MTPTEPSRSAITCLRAPSTLRLSPPERERTKAPVTLIASPTTATAIIQPPRMGGGSCKRAKASTKIQTETATSVTPFARAARISARLYPKLLCGVAGFPARPARPPRAEEGGGVAEAAKGPEKEPGGSRH